MLRKQNKQLVGSGLRAIVLMAIMLAGASAMAQTGLYVPSLKPVRNMQKALTNPEIFHLLVSFPADEANYADSDLDMLDSAYRIAFDVSNPMLYSMTIESYGSTSTQVAQQRADALYRYFAMRCHSHFPIRLARNPIHCSCQGDTAEVLRFEVPVSTVVYRCAELSEERLLLNRSVPLQDCVLITFRNAPDDCVGAARGCFIPQKDSTIYGYYSSLTLGRGSVYTVENTKDTCPTGWEIKIDDHLDYREWIDQYRLVPHRKQLIAMAGYVVITPHWPIRLDSCTEKQQDSIFLRIPMTQEQMDAKLKFYAKVRTARGIEYRTIPTRKMPGKGALGLQATLNIDQLDTIYIGKKLESEEMDKYFYRLSDATEAAAFEAGGRYYVAARPDRMGELQMKKPLLALMKAVFDQEEEALPKKSKTPKGEEIPD